MNYSEYKPSEEFKNIVKNYWRFDVPENDENNFSIEHETLPHSEVSIVFIKQPYFEGIRLLGPQIRKFEKTIYPNSFYFGIRLLPWLNFTPSLFNKHELLNVTADCPKVIAQHLESLQFDRSSEPEKMISLVEQRLADLFTQSTRVTQNNYIKYICLELSSGRPVGATIDRLPISARVIQKKFKEVVGMSMRKYHSISRQRQLWTDMVKMKKEKVDLLYEYGFFDQAHFINDFKKHMNQPHADFEKRLNEITISLT